MAKTIPDYKLLFMSGCDFAINRKTSRTDTTLVFIYAKKIFSIIDEKKKTSVKITEPEQVTRFIGNYDVSKIKLFNRYNMKRSAETLINLIKNENPAIDFLMRKSLLSTDAAEIMLNRYTDNNENVISSLYKTEPKILARIFSLKPNRLSFYDEMRLCNTCNSLLNVSNRDDVMYLLNQLSKVSGTTLMTIAGSNISNLVKYGLDTKRLVDYLLFELPKQNEILHALLNEYEDYLSLCKKFYGNVPNKYPVNMQKEHDCILAKIQDQESIEKYEIDFAEIMEDKTDYEYRNPIDKFQIVVPREAKELIDEGRNLSHCVGDYISKVVNGDCVVVFMRKEKNESHLTIEISPDGSICQIEGLNRRYELTEDEITFLERWAKNKDLKITAMNAA